MGTRMPPLPQRLLGRDLFWWLTHLGIMRVSVESRLGRRMAQRDVLIGSSRRRLTRAGVTIRERLEGFEGRRAAFADGSRLDVGAVVWATGYRSDYAWIEVPGVTGENGRVLHRRGVTAAPGLFFVGLPWQHTRGSALLGFVQADAAFVVETLAASAEGAAAQVLAPSGRSRTPSAGPATRDLSGAAMTQSDLSTPGRAAGPSLGGRRAYHRPGRLGGRRRRPSGGCRRSSSGGSMRRPSTHSAWSRSPRSTSALPSPMAGGR